METKVIINGKSIGEYSVFVDRNASECENFSALEFQRYVKMTTGDLLPVCVTRPEGAYVEFSVSKPENKLHGEIRHDGFAIEVDGDAIKVYAKEERGVLYGSYELLEKMGWRFVAQRSCQRGMEWHDYMLPCEYNKNEGKTTELTITSYVNNPGMFYRDSINYCNFEEDFCAKIRLNAETWGSRKFGAQRGDALGMSGRNGHSFGALVPHEIYAKTHPEYYAEINGKRIVDNDPHDGSSSGLWGAQLCMTNDDLVPIAVKKLCEWAENAHPARKIVSVSQNDNQLFCQCEKCRKAYAERGGIGGVLVDFVNKVAEEFEKFYPDFLIHTYLYWGTAEAVLEKEIKFRKNVMPQYCITHCHNHAIEDESCEYNKHPHEILKRVGRLTENLFIWDYRSPLGSALAIMPNIRFLRQNMATMARNNVKGIYSEMALFNFCTPNLEELRSYLYGKLTWNPYMSEEEYQQHIDDFLEGYYGKGWRHVKEMINYYENACSGPHHINMTPDRFDVKVYSKDEIISPQNSRVQNRQRALFFDKDKAEEICEHCRELIEKARKEGTSVNRHRLNVLDTGIIWLQLHLLMEDKVNAGGAEKDKYVKLNILLLENMRIYCMKYTAEIGMRNIQFMYDGKYELPVSKWESNAAYGGVE